MIQCVKSRVNFSPGLANYDVISYAVDKSLILVDVILEGKLFDHFFIFKKCIQSLPTAAERVIFE